VGGSLYQTSLTGEERDRINELTAPGRRLYSYYE
jgi:hypothetical protein